VDAADARIDPAPISEIRAASLYTGLLSTPVAGADHASRVALSLVYSSGSLRAIFPAFPSGRTFSRDRFVYRKPHLSDRDVTR